LKHVLPNIQVLQLEIYKKCTKQDAHQKGKFLVLVKTS